MSIALSDLVYKMNEIKTITRDQVRAARAFLGWSIDDLADSSGVSKNTISQFEKGDVNIRRDTMFKLLSSLDSAGVDFPDQFTVTIRRRHGLAVEALAEDR